MLILETGNLKWKKKKEHTMSLQTLVFWSFHDVTEERKVRIMGYQHHYVENVGTQSGVQETVCLVDLMVWK